MALIRSLFGRERAESQDPADTGNVTPEVADLWEDFIEHGNNPEYTRFENQFRFQGASATSQGRAIGSFDNKNIWDFIEDALTGTGGFADGGYLQPHSREYNKSTNMMDPKFLQRRAISQYDNFVKPIVETPWNYIVQMRESIERTVADNAPTEIETGMKDFWLDADGRGTDMTDFMEYVAGQARCYGTAWVVVDRPSIPLTNRSVDEQTAVYAYCVPTRHVLHWTFDDDYRLNGVVIKEPWEDAQAEDSSEQGYDIRIWTTTGWAVYSPSDVGKAAKPGLDWTVSQQGTNELGEVPVVQVFDEDPGPGKGLGKTVIPTICRVALTVFNQMSEIREIQRNCGFPIFAVPMKDATQVPTLTLGSENILGFDGLSGMPAWVTQDLAEARAIAEDMESKKTAAFATAHMAAMVGYIQTSSGFHTEAEFDKTNRRIGKFASSMERGENRIGRIVLRYRGLTDEGQIRDTFNVTYPRDFGIRDINAIVERSRARLDMVLGQEDAEETIYGLYLAEAPRADPVKLRERAKAAAAQRYEATGGGPAASTATIPASQAAVNDATAKAATNQPTAQDWAAGMLARARAGMKKPTTTQETAPKGGTPGGPASLKPGEVGNPKAGAK